MSFRIFDRTFGGHSNLRFNIIAKKVERKCRSAKLHMKGKAIGRLMINRHPHTFISDSALLIGQFLKQTGG